MESAENTMTGNEWAMLRRRMATAANLLNGRETMNHYERTRLLYYLHHYAATRLPNTRGLAARQAQHDVEVMLSHLNLFFAATPSDTSASH